MPVNDEAGCGCTSPEQDGHGCCCEVEPVVHVLGKRHSLSILSLLGHSEASRFTDIQSRLHGISPSMLTLRLGELEHAGLVERKSHSDVKHPRYALSARGADLHRLLHDYFPRPAAGSPPPPSTRSSS